MDAIIKQGDTSGKFTDILKVNGVPVNLTGATVSFVMRAVGRIVVSQAAVITNPPGTNGAVEYQPVTNDVAFAGEFKQQWKAVFSDGKILTFPNNTYNKITILPNLQ